MFPQVICVTLPQCKVITILVDKANPHSIASLLCVFLHAIPPIPTSTQHIHPRLAFLEVTDFLISL